MTQLKTMYPGVANSPDTFLVEGLTIDGTVMYVADGAVFGEIPTLAVIGQAELAETVQITGKQSDGGLTIIRGVEGKRKAWAKATNVARNWTNKDYEALRSNITAINDEVGNKVDKVAGKGLSTHDYTDAAKAKVDAIPPDPKYTDTVPDLTPYAKAADLSTEREERKADVKRLNDAQSVQAADIRGVRADIKTAKDTHSVDIQRLESQKLNKTDVPTKLSQLTEDGEHRTVTDAEKKKVQAIPADPKYTDTIPDLSPYAKATDIKTRLADMTEDSEHRTVTDAEKKAWSEGGEKKDQYLYDILMGESLVTRKAGERPVVRGKPTSIESRAFQNNRLTSVVIPPSVTTIRGYAFYNNQLTSVIIPPSVTSIGDGAFSNNQLTSVVIPPSVKNIGSFAFKDNQLTSVVIPPGVTNIETRAFARNLLSRVKVPQGCTIEDDTFDTGVNIIRY